MTTALSTELVDTCDLCGSTASDVLVPETRDRLHNLPGRFTLIKCSQCDLVRLSPRPAASALAGYYPADEYSAHQPPRKEGLAGHPDRRFSRTRETVRRAILRAARGYDNVLLPSWTKAVPRRLPRRLVRQASYGYRGFPEWVPGGRALDLGCGNGVFLYCIARHGWDVVGVDLSAEAARVAHDSFGITVHTGELEDAPLEPGSLDFVHLSHVIEHLVRPVETLRRVANLLRPGGRLYIETPNIDSLAFKWSGPYWHPLDSPRHLWLFSPETLWGTLEQCGFSVISLDGRSRPTFDWEATYRREEQNGGVSPNRPAPSSEGIARDLAMLRALPRSDRPRVAARTILSRAASHVSPRFGDIISCWSELRSDSRATAQSDHTRGVAKR